ncbi:YaaC family protein [Erwinia sp. PsM31]|uniref:YaaC family protein n=1 Tax=Erwinia sp. PsM31 TaxID=3030535 RepID=UPI00263A8EAB|nr:YaaC family protein [Erwinia sp. PsM31]MDN4626582.1 YaaC family protein [Erwinia sp. PsM31]
MSIIQIRKYLNGFPLFSMDYNKLKIGSGEKIIISDIWAFWDYILKRYIEKTTKTTTDKLRKEKVLFSFLEQARNFYESAENSPVKSQPLLYYYAFLNLSKIAINISRSDNVLFKGYIHGISEDYQSEFSKSSVTIKTSNNGDIQVAHEMLRLFDLSKAPPYNNGPKKLNIRDILSHCIGIHRSYSEIYKKPEFFIKIIDHTLFRKGKILYFRGDLGCLNETDAENLVKSGYNIIKFKDGICHSSSLQNGSNIHWSLDTGATYPGLKDGHYYYICSITMRYSKDPTQSEYYNLSKEIRKDGVWYYIGSDGYTIYISKCMDPSFRYSQESIIYMMMFYLGSITRYRPHLFDSLFSNKEQWLVSEFLKTQPKQYLYLLTAQILGQQVTKAYAMF